VAALGIVGLVALRALRQPIDDSKLGDKAGTAQLENSPPAPDVATGPVGSVPTPDSAETTAPDAPPRVDNTKVTDDVRTEVLKRIDAMPIAREKKDKLYASVLRAKEMRRIIVVPFASGGRTLPPREQAALKTLVNSPEVMKVREDLTAVFVVLGFADSKGDEKANLAISADRAKHVKDFLTGPCGVKNITHDVAMGGSKLVDEQRLEKNRIVEVWTVLP
jgi:outer membrane protein OmpA-like peptidoglycan-associated protein